MTQMADDTQPRSPFKDRADLLPPLLNPEEDSAPTGPGCLVWSVIGLASFACALVVVLLAATAGWTAGQRVAQNNATATKSAEVQEQLRRMSDDVAAGNLLLLQRRIEFVSALTPAVPQVQPYIQTATALYLTSLPTTTPTATLTPTPSPTSEVLAITVDASSGYDLDAYLKQARDAIALGQWAEAIELLDVLLGADPAYQTAAVRGLMLEALRTQANRLYNENKLAEAIFLTDRANTFGLSVQDPLRYEKYAAELYLDAVRTTGTDYLSSIRALQLVYALGPSRYYDDVRQRLFQQYTAYADAWALQNEFCPAYTQYQNALSILANASVAAKRDNANLMCLQATPTPSPDDLLDPTTNGQPIAPIGAVETPTGG